MFCFATRRRWINGGLNWKFSCYIVIISATPRKDKRDRASTAEPPEAFVDVFCAGALRLRERARELGEMFPLLAFAANSRLTAALA